ncbi:transposable element Tcb1 transposase [Trichonephila clavipes]|nr:transposable element Tcb1 transposase [Trichonephila clavipes]
MRICTQCTPVGQCEATLLDQFHYVLSWIQQEELWSVFENNKVQEIRELTDPTLQKHLPEAFNPADLPSRGVLLTNSYAVDVGYHLVSTTTFKSLGIDFASFLVISAAMLFHSFVNTVFSPWIPLTANHRLLRLQWAHEHRAGQADWHQIVFSDESRFNLWDHDIHICVTRYAGECCLLECVIE